MTQQILYKIVFAYNGNTPTYSSTQVSGFFFRFFRMRFLFVQQLLVVMRALVDAHLERFVLFQQLLVDASSVVCAF